MEQEPEPPVVEVEEVELDEVVLVPDVLVELVEPVVVVLSELVELVEPGMVLVELLDDVLEVLEVLPEVVLPEVVLPEVVPPPGDCKPNLAKAPAARRNLPPTRIVYTSPAVNSGT